MASHGFAFRSEKMQKFCIPGTKMQKKAEWSNEDILNKVFVLKTDPSYFTFGSTFRIIRRSITRL
jgi:hypothetical protein